MFSTRPWNQLREECILQEPLSSPFVEWNKLPEKLKPGDLIEFSRPGSSSDYAFKHWSVYEGERQGVPHVISYTTRGENGKEEVKSEPLEDVAGGRKGRKHNKWDEQWEPLPNEEILKRAHELRLRRAELTSNEHFALDCRYGENWAKPVIVAPHEPLLKTVYEGTMVLMMIPVAVVIFGSLYWIGRCSEAIKNRRQPVKEDDK